MEYFIAFFLLFSNIVLGNIIGEVGVVEPGDPPPIVVVEDRKIFTEYELIRVPNNTSLGFLMKINEIADEYGVSAKVMVEIILCESNFDADVQSRIINQEGERERSYGLVQINTDYHDVTREQAIDPEFAIEFLAEKLSKGKGYLWSCWKKFEKLKK